MPYLLAAMVLLWFVVLLYVVFLVHKQKQLEAIVRELQRRAADPDARAK